MDVTYIINRLGFVGGGGAVTRSWGGVYRGRGSVAVLGASDSNPSDSQETQNDGDLREGGSRGGKINTETLMWRNGKVKKLPKGNSEEDWMETPVKKE